ncbi:hypothetical protein [Pseudomonas sp. Xaverov 259]|uniref:hypothetical protein n=1 Tax=Pseudomonas sp. Xaverov 259 TaxID=2666086 RepID=UPI001C5BB74B|nr:hypothetical protein [Pseudomonas sp. Xaverov 259]
MTAITPYSHGFPCTLPWSRPGKIPSRPPAPVETRAAAELRAAINLAHDFEIFEDPKLPGSITLKSLWAVATGEKPGVSKAHQALAKKMFMLPGFLIKLDVINGSSPTLYDKSDGVIKRANIESFIGSHPLRLTAPAPVNSRPHCGGAQEHNSCKPKY